MTVAYLASGASVHTVRWVNALASMGVDVHLLSLHSPEEAIDTRVEIYRAPFAAPCGYLLNILWARKALSEIRPDLLHVHYASGYGTLGASVGFHPTILSVWGDDVYGFPKRSPLHRAVIVRNLSKADVILATSKCMARHVAQFTRKTVDVTPFGVDLGRLQPQEAKGVFDPSDIVVGTVKGLEPKYGIDVLIRAFHILRNRQPSMRLRLLIVGRGSQERELKQLVSDLGLSKDVVFTGAVKHEEVVRYLNMLTVYVAVSVEESESFGVAVLEASACEKPVVVSDVGGLPEVVAGNVTGVIVPRRNADATADAIEKLLLDEDLRRRMGAAGRDRVRRLFDWRANVTQMLAIYESVVAGAYSPVGIQEL